MNEKYFIITVDTEADNQWDSSHIASTDNVNYLPRFQELSEKYELMPTWLTTYEMACNHDFVSYFDKKNKDGLCEIGMHLHSWNSPPLDYRLNKVNAQRDFLIEYPVVEMEKKIKFLTEFLTEQFGVSPVSHRSGRWILNKDCISILEKYGYIVDCSVTPLVSWKNTCGSTGVNGNDYSSSPFSPYYIGQHLLEVPVSIRQLRFHVKENISCFHNFCGEMKRLLIGRTQWLRPKDIRSSAPYLKLIDRLDKENTYAMFMIHSSELMPGGSPTFKTTQDIENLYRVMEDVFCYAKEKGYTGICLRDYAERYKKEKKNIRSWCFE